MAVHCNGFWKYSKSYSAHLNLNIKFARILNNSICVGLEERLDFLLHLSTLDLFSMYSFSCID